MADGYAQRVPQTIPSFPHEAAATFKNASRRNVKWPVSEIPNEMLRNVFRAGGTNAPPLAFLTRESDAARPGSAAVRNAG